MCFCVFFSGNAAHAPRVQTVELLSKTPCCLVLNIFVRFLHVFACASRPPGAAQIGGNIVRNGHILLDRTCLQNGKIAWNIRIFPTPPRPGQAPEKAQSSKRPKRSCKTRAETWVFLHETQHFPPSEERRGRPRPPPPGRTNVPNAIPQGV